MRPAFSGGLTLPRREPSEREWVIRQMPFAPKLYLPLRQQVESSAAAVVREGEEVTRGQVLAQPETEGAVPLHAPATGRVLSLAEQPDPTGGTVPVICLAPFPGDTQEYPGGPGLDPDTATAERVLAAIRKAGIIGQGGVGRPTHARLAKAAAGTVNWVVLNGIESESEFQRVPLLLRKQAAEVLMGLRYLLKALGAGNAVLAVEGPDEAAAKALLAAAPPGLPLRLQVLPPRYPQGAEELLLRVLSGKAGGAGRRLIDAGALSFSLGTAAEIGRLLASELGVTEQLVSFAGGALRAPGFYRVPLGTPLRFALAQAGLRTEPARVLRGGLMRGEALASLEVPVTKGMTGVLVLDRSEAAATGEPLPCVRCGECVAVCPVQLHPAQLGLLGRKGDLQAMHEEYHLDHCFECGCCAYVCPSHIPLVQVFRAAKAQWRRRRPATTGEGAS